MNLDEFKKELMKDKEFAKEYGKFDLENYLTGIRINLGLTTSKFLLIIFIILSIFNLAMFYVTVKQSIREVELLRVNCISCER